MLIPLTIKNGNVSHDMDATTLEAERFHKCGILY